MLTLGALVLIIHYSLIFILCLFGIHRLSMVARWLWYRKFTATEPQPLETLPAVTVQIPLYNERFVAERVIKAVAGFDYPKELLQIQIVDDSTDDTVDIVARWVNHFKSQGVNISHVRRDDRVGYKAGGLKNAMRFASGEFIAIFDADFLPEPELLKRTVHHFQNNEVGMIQFRWEHLNKYSSGLTQTQAIMLDAHFALEQQVRYASGLFFNFNGTAGIWRTKAIVDAGHWSADTLTEDLDLSYRAQLRGWKMLYLNHVSCPGEIPADMPAFKSQQHRWAKGGVQVMKKMLGTVWRAPVSIKHKLESTFHLSNNLAYLIMLIDSVLFLIPSLLIRDALGVTYNWWFDLPMLLLASFSHLIYMFAGQVALGRSIKRTLILMPRLFLLGIQLAYNNAKAGIEALKGQESEFVRTPKSGELQSGMAQGAELGRIAKLYTSVYPQGFGVEFLLSLVFFVVAVWAVYNQRWFMLPILVFLIIGFMTTSVYSLIGYFRSR